MRTLSFNESIQVAGAVVDPIAGSLIVGAGLLAGTAGYSITSSEYVAPLSTAIGTIGTSIACGVVGTALFPVVGTMIGLTFGGIMGYAFSSTFASVGAAFGGFALGGGGAAYALGLVAI